MGMKDVLQELGGYSALLEMSSNPGLQVVGKRLGELAARIVKEVPVAVGDFRVNENGSYSHTYLNTRNGMPINPAPTPETLLIKDMADWWECNRNKSFTLELHAEIAKLTYRAHCIVHP